MATKAGKKGRSKARATAQQGDAGRLRELIQGVIDARHGGDPKLQSEARKALEKFDAKSPELNLHAIEARSAAGHSVASDAVRILEVIRGRLDAVA